MHTVLSPESVFNAVEAAAEGFKDGQKAVTYAQCSERGYLGISQHDTHPFHQSWTTESREVVMKQLMLYTNSLRTSGHCELERMEFLSEAVANVPVLIPVLVT